MFKRTVGMFFVSLVSLSVLVIAAESPMPITEQLSGTYAGEAVVRSLGESSLVVAVDETGEGTATHLFFIETANPVGTISLASAVSRIERTPDTLVVTLPREHRAFAFSLAPETERNSGVPNEPRQKRAPGARLEVTRFNGVRAIREYQGNLAHVLPPNVTMGAIGAKGLQAFSAAAIETEYPDTGSGNGGGCVRSCSTSCGDGSSCSATCGAGQCGTCSCLFGASCSCK